ncbi:hypothetical protein [Glycocaulis alkaliphilus]|uniref:hypothetical protein n=1 Tax=Glycocaulis alkaliphilus TaxID=1434191 RepID=UPI000FD730EB|nr:hypothetical protein [Glycocaulis alkaliphilus]GGB78987.1 hypothetical protein GCM10007417_18630 [Glycocaulis alkaliphilus]
MVVPLGTANIPPMIGEDNQVARPVALWLERASLAAGGLGLLAFGAGRAITGEGLAYPQSLLWMVPCALLAAGCALLYWRVATRTPQ